MSEGSGGEFIRDVAAREDIEAFVGVYDVFSAAITARRFDNLFLSGFGFAASHYGLPDRGFISWSDMVEYTRRIRAVLPRPRLLVDIDDGYGDADVACHVVGLLAAAGATGFVLEDQRRPRRCGHYSGKQLLELDEFLPKLERVLAQRGDCFVVARTDATEPDDVLRRARAFADAGADAVLVDGVPDLGVVAELRRAIDRPLVVNQLAGGRTPSYSLGELRDAGASFVIYSTPSLFAAQAAMEAALDSLKARDGRLGGPARALTSPSAPSCSTRSSHKETSGEFGRRVARVC